MIYLAGPMHCYSGKEEEWDDQVLHWRQLATTKLAALGFGVLDPTLRPYTGINEVEIVEADLEEVRKSDGVLAYLPNVPMAGTPMEIFFASYVLKLPVFAFSMENDGPWIKYFTDQYPTIDKAVEAINHWV